MKPEVTRAYNVAEAGWKTEEFHGTNLRLFLSAGWLLTESWQTCSNEAEAAMYSPGADKRQRDGLMNQRNIFYGR